MSLGSYPLEKNRKKYSFTLLERAKVKECSFTLLEHAEVKECSFTFVRLYKSKRKVEITSIK